MAGVIHIPWYATGFRGDRLQDALADVSVVALRYGAKGHAVYRYQDDRYKFLQVAEFDVYEEWERYWNGPEFTDFRVLCSGWYQVPVLYGWTDLVTSGSIVPEHDTRSVEADVREGDLAG